MKFDEKCSYSFGKKINSGSQLAFIRSKSTIEELEKGVKYDQS